MTKSLIPTTSLAFFLTLTAASSAAGDAKAIVGKRFAFIPDNERLVAAHRGNWVIVGRLDESGDIVHGGGTPIFPAPFSGGSRFEQTKLEKIQAQEDFDYFLCAEVISPNERKKVVFEFRSGMLIRGTLSGEEGRFVPKQGSSIISLNDYLSGDDAAPIYNLPGRIVPVKKPADWEFKPLPGRRVAKIRNHQVSIGKLAEDGSFTPDRTQQAFPDPFRVLDYQWYQVQDSPLPLTVEERMQVLKERFVDREKLKGVPIFNKPSRAEEPVYELRGRKLVLGYLSREGNFFEKKGVAPISFGDYPKETLTPRIYNLPGEWVEKKAKGE